MGRWRIATGWGHLVKKQTMNHPQKRRTPEQVRAGNLRLGLILFAIAAVFFLGFVLRQWLWH
ncbi:hypothetical protein DWV00_05890 [Trinickia dinghuensis]|uniref:Uncharacterized protein n=1 Tax=Trinickia dinghuensis TaxID=2291023 RepID=A0A3D8K3Y8_9BURK|nr:hypothetical protein DWV00_05890 [Trinickia dinghuensis]